MADDAERLGVDLERLASAYEHRSVGAGDRDRAGMAARAAGIGPGDLVVDVGGGRGSHGEVFAATGARVVVADLSPAMAAHSRASGLLAVVADGQCLPLADGVARLAYFHLSIHHGEPDRMIGEAARVTNPGGMVWVWTLDPTHHRASFLARWFPSVGAIDEERFPHLDALMDLMRDEGLAPLPSIVQRDTVVRAAGEWESAVRSGFVSTLHLLAPEEIEEGLMRFREAHPDPAEPIEYDLTYCSVAGARDR